MQKDECCGNCAWHERCDGEWVCANDDSEYWGLETTYSDCCDQYEMR